MLGQKIHAVDVRPAAARPDLARGNADSSQMAFFDGLFFGPVFVRTILADLVPSDYSCRTSSPMTRRDSLRGLFESASTSARCVARSSSSGSTWATSRLSSSMFVLTPSKNGFFLTSKKRARILQKRGKRKKRSNFPNFLNTIF